ncbi:MAG: hypothetical protein AABY01_01620 [Nanoarchaeota archaeon]
MKPIHKTTLLAIVICAATILTATYVQLSAHGILPPCSYLDPPIVDYLAFSAGLFLLIEGAYSINKNKNIATNHQLARIMRIAFGCAIVTLHTLQFLHK